MLPMCPDSDFLQSYLDSTGESHHLPHAPTEVLSNHDMLSQPWREWGDGTGYSTAYSRSVGDSTSDRIAQRPRMAEFPSRLVTPELCTVTINTNGPRPEYVVISYTWGRWTCADRSDDTAFPGGYWKIPANKLFTRKDLDVAIQKISGGSHAWVDVFCIPQDDGDPQKGLEIGKQSAIFRSASRAAVWLSTGGEDILAEVCSWQPEVVYMISEAILNFDAGPSLEYSGFHMETREKTRKRLETIAKFSDLVPWASSLWTLQEAALRPDAVFYDKKGEAILHKITGNPITIKHLSSTMRAIRYELLDVMGYHYGACALDDPDLWGLTEDDISLILRAINTVNTVSLHKLGSMNAGELLLASRQRTTWSPHDRVYGIMGAIGVSIAVDYKADPEDIMNSFLVELHNQLPVEIQAFHRISMYRPESRQWLMDEDARLLTLLRQKTSPTDSVFTTVGTFGHLVANHVQYLPSTGVAEIKGCLLAESAVLASDRCGFSHFVPVSSNTKLTSRNSEPVTACLLLDHINTKARLAVVYLGTISGLEHRSWSMAYLLLAVLDASPNSTSAARVARKCLRLGILVTATELFFTRKMEGIFEII